MKDQETAFHLAVAKISHRQQNIDFRGSTTLMNTVIIEKEIMDHYQSLVIRKLISKLISNK